MQSKYDAGSKVWSGPSYPYPFSMDKMLGDLIYKNVCENPETILQITESDGCAITCEDLRINAIRIAQNLRKIGIVADDVVTLFLKSTHFTTYLVNACIFIGAILNPLEASFDEDNIKHLICKIKPKIIVCEDEDVAKINKILKVMDFLVPIYSTSNDSSHSAMDFLKPTDNEDKFVLPKFNKPSNKKLLAIMCSSGTTGKPKGACIPHSTFLQWMPFYYAQRETTTSICYSPLCWTSSFIKHTNTSIGLLDVQIFTERPFEVDNFLDICEKYQITRITMPSSHLAMLLHSKQFLSSVPKSLTSFLVMGSVLSMTLRVKFEQFFGDKQLLISYGLTECSASLTLPMEYKKEYSVGSMIFHNVSIKIVDDYGNKIENGQPGEIYIKTLFGFSGYYNDPEATRNATDSEGFFKTGDIGYFDENGMLYVIDRKKDIVKSKSHQINASEIENFIESIDGVQYASVVIIYDEIYTPILAAAVVKLKGYEELTEKHVLDYVACNLPEHKHLHGGVYFLDTMPMTSTGKIHKRIVSEEIEKLKSSK